MSLTFLIVAFGGIFMVAYTLGWVAGRSSGKVAAIEEAHGIDLSDGEGSG